MDRELNPLSPIRLLLVDDEDIIRKGLRGLLELESRFEVVGEAHDGFEALELARRTDPDVILMDIQMPGMGGIDATRQLKELDPTVQILILTSHEGDEQIVQAMMEGAKGYVLKNTPLPALTRTIQAVYEGYLQLGPGLGQKLLSNMTPANAVPAPIWGKLTAREKEVAQLLGSGASNGEIANTLCITEKTVKNHVSNILSRMGLRDRTQVALWVSRFFRVPLPQLNSI